MKDLQRKEMKDASQNHKKKLVELKVSDEEGLLIKHLIELAWNNATGVVLI